MAGNLWILAQNEANEAPATITSRPIDTEQTTLTTTASDPNTSAAPTAQRPLPVTQWVFLGLMFLIMYLILFRAPRKRQQQHKQMVQSLQKNDRVRTIGGIIGTVVDIKGDEITLKVDESNNTKIKVVASAIGKNLSKDNP